MQIQIINFDWLLFTKHKCKYLQENANVWIGMKLKVGNLKRVKPNIWENFENLKALIERKLCWYSK